MNKTAHYQNIHISAKLHLHTVYERKHLHQVLKYQNSPFKPRTKGKSHLCKTNQQQMEDKEQHSQQLSLSHISKLL